MKVSSLAAALFGIAFWCLPGHTYAYLGNRDTFYLAQPIPADERVLLRRLKIRHLVLWPGAELHIVTDPSSFPALTAVSIELQNQKAIRLIDDSATKPPPDPNYFTQLPRGISASTEEFLLELARHYPGITSLTISQQQPLSQKALSTVMKFRKLESLQLNCPTESEGLLEDLPPSLRSLRIEGSYSLPNLPRLEELTIENCRLGPEFLRQLNASKLRKLTLDRCVVPEGSLKCIDRFKRLKWLDLTTSHPESPDDWMFLRELPDVRVLLP